MLSLHGVLTPPPLFKMRQDPESREAMQEGLLLRKEHAFTLDSGKLPRMRNTRSGATFNSYLTDPDQAPARSVRQTLHTYVCTRTNALLANKHE